MGVIAYQAGEYRAAAGLIQRAIDINSTNPANHNDLGYAFKAKSPFPGAIDWCRRAVDGDPSGFVGDNYRKNCMQSTKRALI
jgi:hypothetical protein